MIFLNIIFVILLYYYMNLFDLETLKEMKIWRHLFKTRLT